MADDVTQGKSGDSPSVLDPELGKDAPLPRDVAKPKDPPAPTVAEESEELDEDLDAQVGEMIAEARRQEDLEDEPEPESTEPADEPDPMPDADKARATSLSDLAFELLESDLDDHTDDFDDSATPGDQPGAGATASPTETPEPERPAARERSEHEHAGVRIAQDAWWHVRRVGLMVWRRVLPLGARGVIEVNKPLESRSDSLRQTVGWLALYTAFLGVCVWVYVLLVRTPPETIASDTPASLVAETQGSGSASPVSGSLSSSRDARQD